LQKAGGKEISGRKPARINFFKKSKKKSSNTHAPSVAVGPRDDDDLRPDPELAEQLLHALGLVANIGGRPAHRQHPQRALHMWREGK
jgi:hypothetical protein